MSNAIRTQIIISHAWKLFRRYGYRRFRMVDLNKTTGLSVGQIHTVFSSKKQLFCSAVQYATNFYIERYSEVLDNSSNLQEICVNFINQAQDLVTEFNPFVYEMVMHEQRTIPDLQVAMDHLADTMQCVLKSRLDHLITKKELVPFPSDEISRIVLTMVVRSLQQEDLPRQVNLIAKDPVRYMNILLCPYKRGTLS